MKNSASASILHFVINGIHNRNYIENWLFENELSTVTKAGKFIDFNVEVLFNDLDSWTNYHINDSNTTIFKQKGKAIYIDHNSRYYFKLDKLATSQLKIEKSLKLNDIKIFKEENKDTETDRKNTIFSALIRDTINGNNYEYRLYFDENLIYNIEIKNKFIQRLFESNIALDNEIFESIKENIKETKGLPVSGEIWKNTENENNREKISNFNISYGVDDEPGKIRMDIPKGYKNLKAVLKRKKPFDIIKSIRNNTDQSPLMDNMARASNISGNTPYYIPFGGYMGSPSNPGGMPGHKTQPNNDDSPGNVENTPPLSSQSAFGLRIDQNLLDIIKDAANTLASGLSEETFNLGNIDWLNRLRENVITNNGPQGRALTFLYCILHEINPPAKTDNLTTWWDLNSSTKYGGRGLLDQSARKSAITALQDPYFLICLKYPHNIIGNINAQRETLKIIEYLLANDDKLLLIPILRLYQADWTKLSDVEKLKMSYAALMALYGEIKLPIPTRWDFNLAEFIKGYFSVDLAQFKLPKVIPDKEDHLFIKKLQCCYDGSIEGSVNLGSGLITGTLFRYPGPALFAAIIFGGLIPVVGELVFSVAAIYSAISLDLSNIELLIDKLNCDFKIRFTAADNALYEPKIEFDKIDYGFNISATSKLGLINNEVIYEILGGIIKEIVKFIGVTLVYSKIPQEIEKHLKELMGGGFPNTLQKLGAEFVGGQVIGKGGEFIYLEKLLKEQRWPFIHVPKYTLPALEDSHLKYLEGLRGELRLPENEDNPSLHCNFCSLVFSDNTLNLLAYHLWKSKRLDCAISDSGLIQYIANSRPYPLPTGRQISWFSIIVTDAPKISLIKNDPTGLDQSHGNIEMSLLLSVYLTDDTRYTWSITLKSTFQFTIGSSFISKSRVVNLLTLKDQPIDLLIDWRNAEIITTEASFIYPEIRKTKKTETVTIISGGKIHGMHENKYETKIYKSQKFNISSSESSLYVTFLRDLFFACFIYRDVSHIPQFDTFKSDGSKKTDGILEGQFYTLEGSDPDDGKTYLLKGKLDFDSGLAFIHFDYNDLFYRLFKPALNGIFTPNFAHEFILGKVNLNKIDQELLPPDIPPVVTSSLILVDSRGLGSAPLDTLDLHTHATGLLYSFGFYLANRGPQPVEINKIEIINDKDGVFAIDPGLQMPITVNPRSVITVQASFLSSKAAQYTAQLRIYSNDPVQSVLIISLISSSWGELPQIQVSDMELNYGQVSVGVSISKKITLRNTGTGDVAISIISTLLNTSFHPPFSYLNQQPTLLPGGEFTFDLYCEPTQRGSLEDAAIFSAVGNSRVSKPFSIKLRAIGIAPLIQLQPSELDFGDIPAEMVNNKTLPLNIGNIGDDILTVDFRLKLGRQSFIYPIPTNGFPIDLAPGATTVLPITFSAMFSPGESITEIWEFLSNDPFTPELPFELRARFVGPRISIKQGDINFGTIMIRPPVSKDITIENIGTTDLEVQKIVLTNGKNYSLSGVASLPIIIPSGAQTIFQAVFNLNTGDLAGSYSDTLLVVSNDSTHSIKSLFLFAQI